MRLRELGELVEQSEALDGPASMLADAAAKAVPAGPVKDTLSGTWLGHALHPVLTDLPIGFWTSAFVLDLVGGKQSRKAADLMVALGVASAIPTAASGLSDFGDTAGTEKRVGLVHAAANTLALGLYTASLVARRRGKRFRGVGLGLAGAAAATLGGYLGGHLLEAMGVGVDNTAFDHGPTSWTSVGAGDELVDGKPLAVDADGVTVLLVKNGADIHALDDRCTHRGGPLHEGEVADGCVTCPWHGSTFRLDDGEIVRGPAAQPQPRFQARLREGKLEVRRAPATA